MNAALRLPSLNLPFLIFRTILQKAGEALLMTATLYGVGFGILSMGGAMPMVARSIIFHPSLATMLKTVGPIAFGIVFALLLFAESIAGLNWLTRNTQFGIRLSSAFRSWKVVMLVKAHPELSTLAFAISLVLAITVLHPAAHPPKPPVYRTFPPANKALLHFEGESASPKGVPAMIWTRNISGPAKIKSLGDGRYLVQMIR